MESLLKIVFIYLQTLFGFVLVLIETALLTAAFYSYEK